MKVLTEAQIESLYAFTRAHFVEHYDIQTELVDHLASGVQQQWEQHPGLDFQQALQLEFKKFGVFGFQDVVAAHMKAVGKTYRKIIWQYYREFLTFPKLALTLCLAMLYYTVLTLLQPPYMKSFALISLLGLIVVFIWKGLRLRKHLKARTQKWLLEDMIFNQLGLIGLFMLPIHIWNIGGNTDLLFASVYGQIGYSCFSTAYSVLLYVSVVVVPQKAQIHLEKEYPEYKIV